MVCQNSKVVIKARDNRANQEKKSLLYEHMFTLYSQHRLIAVSRIPLTFQDVTDA